MSEHTRVRIMNSTANLILLRGYDATRTKDIAEISGVSEATIFKYFKSKEDLLKNIIISMLDKFTKESKINIAACLKKFSIKPNFSYKELLAYIIKERIEYFIKQDKLIKIIVREMLINPLLKKLFVETIYNSLTNVLDVIIKKGVEAGEFNQKASLNTLRDSIFGLIIYNTVINNSLDKSNIDFTDIILKGVIA